MNNKENAKEKISRLVKQFDEHIDEYKKGNYNEHQTRIDYINPFFKALGWDMDNHQGLAEAYREVIHEDKIKIGRTTKAPDYCFTVYGQRKFFVDAKKPSINIKGDISPAYQVRRYGWSAKLPVSIVTDFEEFSIYDCTKKPNQTDKASVSRIKYITYDNYLEEFDFLWDTFAQENILKGRFDKFVKSDTKKRGTAAVDDEFLQSIEEWRKYLATTIALRNKSLNEEEINFAVQRNIDRIIFLRICEDRGIERYGDLKNVTRNGNYYQNLFGLYRIADDKYNSGLFDFKNDNITSSLTVDNKVVKNIINELYYPVSPYEFSVLPADILGSVYERFLGKTIRLTKAHYAKIEEKPEVRKAGGVYYTPKYIVDYIVENTIGKLVKNKNPKDIEKIKIVDPACGSGSFLIGAYQYLLNWHLQYYIKTPPQKKKDNPLTPDGNLTTAEKKRILLNNIYGVDIDAQAVEVTKLNLLLKALEGETNASVSKQLTFFNERVLPNLGDNIKCGNSLIGTDFYDNQLELFPEQIKKINAFDWEIAFPEIFENGGFNVVIGNPPWVSLTGRFGNDIISNEALKYLVVKYKGNTYMPNLYEYFVQKSLDVVIEGGCFSFIVPDRLGYNSQFKNLRERILKDFNIDELIYKAPFPNIVTDTLIFRFSKGKNINNEIIVGEYGKNTQNKSITEYLNDPEYKFYYEQSDEIGKILQKIYDNSNTKALKELVQSTSGFGGKSSVITDMIVNPKQIKVYRGRSIQKYSIVKDFYFEFVKKNITGRTTDPKKLGAKEKVLFRKTGIPIIATYDDSGIFVEQSLYFLFNNISNLSLKYFTALINSNIFNFIYLNKLVTNRDSTPQIKKVDLDTFPVRIINFSNSKEKQTHDTIVSLVNNLLNLNKELQITKLDNQRQQIQRAIAHAESKIDELVYELYGLTEEEIGIVEGLE